MLYKPEKSIVSRIFKSEDWHTKLSLDYMYNTSLHVLNKLLNNNNNKLLKYGPFAEFLEWWSYNTSLAYDALTSNSDIC